MSETELIQDIEQCVASLGAGESTLSVEERASLDESGYVLLHDAIPPDRLRALRSAFDEAKQFSLRPEDPMNKEPGAGRHTNLEYFSPAFEYAFTHRRHVAAVYHVLRTRFHLFTINGRNPGKGAGGQQIHRDAGLDPQRRVLAVQSLWMLDDFTAENGATRIVPGTHRQEPDLHEPLPADKDAPHPRQILLCAPAGTIAVFNSHLMHGGTTNTSGLPRRTLHSTFVPHYFSNQFPHHQWVDDSMFRRLSPSARFLLGVTGPATRNALVEA